MGKAATLLGWKMSSSLFIFLQNNWDGAQADLPVDRVTSDNSVRLCINSPWHLKPRPATGPVSFWNSFPCILSCLSPAEWGGVHLWSAGGWGGEGEGKGLSLHLKHSRSEKSKT